MRNRAFNYAMRLPFGVHRQSFPRVRRVEAIEIRRPLPPMLVANPDLELRPFCSNADCEYAGAGFPVNGGQPVLIDFATSIFDRETYDSDNASVFSAI
jgi:hypothetical protein